MCARRAFQADKTFFIELFSTVKLYGKTEPRQEEQGRNSVVSFMTRQNKQENKDKSVVT